MSAASIQDRFSLDQGELADAVELLLKSSSASEWIEVTLSPYNGKVMEFQAVNLPPESWSTGERLLWRFALSLVGRGTLDVKEFCDYFRHSELRGSIDRVVRIALNTYGEKTT